MEARVQRAIAKAGVICGEAKAGTQRDAEAVVEQGRPQPPSPRYQDATQGDFFDQYLTDDEDDQPLLPPHPTNSSIPSPFTPPGQPASSSGQPPPEQPAEPQPETTTMIPTTDEIQRALGVGDFEFQEEPPWDPQEQAQAFEQPDQSLDLRVHRI